jgi:hypothetical protein
MYTCLNRSLQFEMESKRLKKTVRIISFLTIVLFIVFSGFIGGNSNALSSGNKGSGNGETIKTVQTGNVESANKTSDKELEFTSKTLILTVGYSPVYWPEFHFWLNYIQKYYRNFHNLDKITDWSVKQNGMSLKEFFLSCAVGYACKDRAIEAKAKELGIELSAGDLAEIEKQRKDNIRIYGSESEYLHIVRSMYLSEEVFNYLTKIDYLGNYMFKHLYGAKGEKCTDEEVSAYVKKEGYMCAKYIFLSSTDAEGAALSPEKREENYKLLENILGRLDTSSDPLPLFDALMKESGKDRTILNYPDGRLFVSGGMGEEFESAYLKLKENKYSGVVKDNKGCYIILRKPIFPDMTADSGGNTLRYLTAYEYLFKNQIEGLSAKMKIKYEDAYYKIDIEGLQNN